MATNDDHVFGAVKTLEIAASAITALDTVGELATRALGRNSALEDVLKVLHVIGAIANAVRDGLTGKVTALDVENALLELRTSIQANDQAADAALDAKFPG